MFRRKKSKEIAGGVKALRERILAAKIPSSRIDEALDLATWNIREFGKRRRSKTAIRNISDQIIRAGEQS